MSQLPTPGQEKIVSVRTAPAISVVICRPIDGDDGDERVAQRMDADDPEGREALGAGGADIILLEHLEHRGARHARDHRERDGAEHDGR